MPRKFKFHEGHNVQVIQHQGKAAVVCLDCGVLADIEAISGEITPADALITDKDHKHTFTSKLSKGVKLD